MIHVVHQTQKWSVNMGITDGDLIIIDRETGQAGVFTPEDFDEFADKLDALGDLKADEGKDAYFEELCSKYYRLADHSVSEEDLGPNDSQRFKKDCLAAK